MAKKVDRVINTKLDLDAKGIIDNGVKARTSLKQINEEFKNATAGLNKTSQATEIYEARQEKLTKQLVIYDAELARSKKRLDEARDSGNLSAEQIARLEIAYTKTSTKVKKANAELGQSEKQFKKVSTQADKTSDSLKRSAKAFGLTFASKKAVEGFAAIEAETNKLEFNLKRLGDVGNESFDRIQSKTKELQATGLIDDTQFIAAFNDLANKVGDIDIAEGLIDGLADVAAATGIPFQNLSNQIGTALGGGRLSKELAAQLGIDADEFNKIEDLAEKTEVINEAFGRFEGGLDNFTDTAESSINSFKFAIGNLLEAAGGIIISALGPILDILAKDLFPLIETALIDLVPIITQVGEFFADLISELLPIVTELLQKLLPELISVLEPVIEIVLALAKALLPIVNILFKFLEPALKVFTIQLKPIIKILEFLTPLFESFAEVIDNVIDFILNMINSVIGLINKIPFIEIDLIDLGGGVDQPSPSDVNKSSTKNSTVIDKSITMQDNRTINVSSDVDVDAMLQQDEINTRMALGI